MCIYIYNVHIYIYIKHIYIYTHTVYLKPLSSTDIIFWEILMFLGNKTRLLGSQVASKKIQEVCARHRQKDGKKSGLVA